MPHPHHPTASRLDDDTASPLDDDVDAAVLQWVDDDARAALDFLVDHAADVPGGRQIAECLTRSRRRRPVAADRRAG
jgi:hypothetical protein